MDMNKPVAWMQVHHKDNKPTKFSLVQTWEDDIALYSQDYVNQLLGEIAELKHINKNWQISEGQLLDENEALKKLLNTYKKLDELNDHMDKIFGRSYVAK